MRAAFRNSVAAALAAAIAFSGVNVAEAASEIEIAPITTNTGGLVDSDGDGIPDIWEEEGVVLADGTEIPLPDWGADPHRPDLFLQLNWMGSEYDSLDCARREVRECAQANRKSYAPATQSLDELVDLFDAHGINLHIDAGDYYSNIPNYRDRFGGETLEFRPAYFDGRTPEGIQLVQTVQDLGPRNNIFRPGVIGDRMRYGSNSTGLSLIGDNSFYVANPGMKATEEQLRNSILHEFGHTLGLRHWGAQEETASIPDRAPMQSGYHSVMNYDYQFSNFNYSEQAYFADTPNGKVFVPADWDMLKLDNPRIGAYAKSIGARVQVADEVEVEQPKQSLEVERMEPVKVADNASAEIAAQDDKDDAVALLGTVPADQTAAEQPAKADNVQPVKQAKAAHEEAPKQAAGPNIAAIIGGVVAALAILGLGAGFLMMQ